MILRCSSRLFWRITPSPPKATHCTNLFQASAIFVAALMVRRSSSSFMKRSKKIVLTTRPKAGKGPLGLDRRHPGRGSNREAGPPDVPTEGRHATHRPGHFRAYLVSGSTPLTPATLPGEARLRRRRRAWRTGGDLRPQGIPKDIPLGGEVLSGAIDRFQERQQIRLL
jgi:hypothetical protein